MPNQTVLLAGVTGMVGSQIAERFLDDSDVKLRLLVRQASLDDDDKRAALDGLVDRGAELVTGDVTDPESRAAPPPRGDLGGSARAGGGEVVVDGQVALARAAAANGARRILPSDFALDIFKATPGEHAAFDLRREADEEISDLDIEQINVLVGAFLDGVAMPGAAVEFDDEAGTATFWGSGDEHFEATTIADTARYVARVAVDDSVAPGKFAVAADDISFGEIVAAHEEVTGKKYEPNSRGDADELRAWADARRDEGDHGSELMGRYVQYMITGQTRLDGLQNDRYPDIEPTTLEDLHQRTAS